MPDVKILRAMKAPLRHRQLSAFLEKSGIREPETEHILLAESLVFSEKPSAAAQFPGGVVICRDYDRLAVQKKVAALTPQPLPCPGFAEFPELNLRIVCAPASDLVLTYEQFTVYPQGEIIIRPRCAGDQMRLKGGTKCLKNLFIDRKIPASQRMQIPVLADGKGVLAVWGIGANLERTEGTGSPALIRFENIEHNNEVR